MRVNKTYLQIRLLHDNAASFLVASGNAEIVNNQIVFTTKEMTPLAAVLKKSIKDTSNLLQELEDKTDDLRIKNAAKHPQHGTILRTEKGAIDFTPEGLINFKKQMKELLNQEVEIIQRVVTEWKENLTEEQLEAFSEVVIPKQNID